MSDALERCQICGREFDYSSDDSKDDWEIREDKNYMEYWVCPKCLERDFASKGLYKMKYL